jgi:ABC-type transport system substrate-binding protein
MLKGNEVDVAEIILDQVDDVESSGFKVASDPQPTVLRYHLWGSYYGEPGFDGEGFVDPGPTGNIKVREALNLAINREEMAEVLFLGRAEPVAVYPITSLAIGFPDDLEPYPYDPERAKELLREAGYPNGFTIPLFVPADHPRVNPEAGEAIAQMWSDVGMKVDLDISAYAAARPRRFGGVDTIPWYHCGVIAPANADRPFDGGMGATSTFRGFEVEDHIVPLYFANFTEPSREKRLANNRQAVDYVIGWELQTAFVADRPHYAVGPNIASWTPHAIDAPVFTNAATVVVK